MTDKVTCLSAFSYGHVLQTHDLTGVLLSKPIRVMRIRITDDTGRCTDWMMTPNEAIEFCFNFAEMATDAICIGTKQGTEEFRVNVRPSKG